MRPSRVVTCLLIAGAVAIVWTTDWLDPNWRHELSNALIAWIVIGMLAGVGGLLYLVFRRLPSLPLLGFIALGAIVGSLVGGVSWILSTGRMSAKVVDPQSSSMLFPPNWR